MSAKSPFPTLRAAAVASLGLALLMATTGASLAMTDTAFLKTAILDDNSEVMLGVLAETHGGSPAVKAFGRALEGDHSQARIKAVRLADLRGMTSPRGPTPAAAAEQRRLSGLGGGAFDKAFAGFMIQSHQKAIAVFRAEAETGSGPVARYARMSLPMLRKHLAMAERIERRGA